MKLQPLFFILSVGIAEITVGCAAKPLDGGSNASGSSSSSGSTPETPAESSSGGSGNAAQDGIATTPLTATVAGKPFTPTAIELRQGAKSSRWSLEIHNASTPCAPGRKMGDEIVLVDIQGLGGEGSWPLDPGDAHFQRGFYMSTDAREPETDTSNQGRVRIDVKPGAPGTTVTGGLTVKGDTSELQGTFTATICEPR